MFTAAPDAQREAGLEEHRGDRTSRGGLGEPGARAVWAEEQEGQDACPWEGSIMNSQQNRPAFSSVPRSLGLTTVGVLEAIGTEEQRDNGMS